MPEGRPVGGHRHHHALCSPRSRAARSAATVAMTGEVTLRGRVLAIGGLKEKTMAALRARRTHRHHPAGRTSRICEEIDQTVRAALHFVPVETVDAVFEAALLPARGRCAPSEHHDGAAHSGVSGGAPWRSTLTRAEFVLSAVRHERVHPRRPAAGRPLPDARTSASPRSSTVLLNRKNFARVGATPGKTTQVNYFLIDGKIYSHRICPATATQRSARTSATAGGGSWRAISQEPGLIDARRADRRRAAQADGGRRDDAQAGSARRAVRSSSSRTSSISSRRARSSRISPCIRETLELGERDTLVPFSAEKGTGETAACSA